MFEDSKLKIKWADEHIRNLALLIGGYLQTKFCDFGLKKDGSTGKYKFIIEIIKAPPWQIPLIVGDAIHNLRASLDVLVCDMVRKAGHVPTTWNCLPFRDDRQKLIDAIHGGLEQAIGNRMALVLVDKVRPFRNGGDQPLCALHDADVNDKHLLITPVYRATSALVNLRFDTAGGPLVMHEASILINRNGEIRITDDLPGDFQFQGDLKPAFDIFFEDGKPFGGEPIIPTLHQLSQLASNAVAAIEGAYI